MTIVQNGITSFMDSVFIQDSTSTVGSGKIGLAYTLSGLIIALRADNENAWVSYFGSSGTIESISTIGTYAAPTAGKIRFREEDSIAAPGFYQVMAADAKWAVTNAKFLYMNIQGPGIAQVPQRSQLHPVPSNVIQVLASGVLPLMSGMIQTQADIVLDKTGYIVSVDNGPIISQLSGVIIQRSLPSGEYLTRESTNAIVSGNIMGRDLATQGQLNARTIASASYLQQTSIDSLQINLSGIIDQRTLQSGLYVTRESLNAIMSGNIMGRDLATQGQLNARTIASASYIQQSNLDTLSINLSGVVYQRTLPSGEYATKTDVASSSASGVTDWTAAERAQIRNRIGIDGSASAPSATPTLASAVGLDNLQINLSGIIDQRTLQSGLYLTRESLNAIVSGVVIGRDLATQGQLNARTLATASYLQQTNLDTLQINLSGIIDQRTLQSGLYPTRESLNAIVSGNIMGRDLATQGQLNARTLATASYPTQTNFDNLSINLSGVVVQRTLPSGEYLSRESLNAVVSGVVMGRDLATQGQLNARTIASASYLQQSSVDNLSINLSGVIIQRSLPSGNYLTRDDIRIQTSGVLVGWGTVNQTYLDSRTLVSAGYATTLDLRALSGVLVAGVKVVELTAPAVEDIFSTFTIAEAYAAAGAAGTVAEILYFTQQAFTQFAISGTSIVVKKLDNSATAATFTMNSATVPTSRGRV